MSKPTKIPILKYGARWPHDAHPLEIEFACIAALGQWEDGRGKKCGYGLPFHVKAAMKILWPEMEWHRWVDIIVETFLKSPGKNGVLRSFVIWKKLRVFSRRACHVLRSPKGNNRIDLLHDADALMRRIWDYVVSSDKSARVIFPWLPGSLIESKLMLLADPSAEEGRSFKDGIVGVACKQGGQWKGIEPFVGCKNDVIIVIADEMQFVSEGVLDSLANLESNENCYAALMGNLPDVHNPLARAAEPKTGWDDLVDTDKSRVFETKWKDGRAIQLIGTDSPNLDYPEGQEPFKKLIGRRYIEQCAQNYGRESDKFNMFASGKIPRTSMERTVFTKAMCIKHGAMEQVRWGHNPVVRGYCLDAAYSGVGGDRTPGAPFIFGKDNQNQWRFWLGEIRIYRGSEEKGKSHCLAIAEQCRIECEAHGIPPEHVFYDGTGRSELTIEFARSWSSKVVPLEFGGIATERPTFNGEKWMDGEKKGELKLCYDVFDRFVTELWFAIRHAIISNQMRGLTEDLINESCQRKWEIVRGSKYKIEPKDGEKDGERYGMKARGLQSPDLGDMLACGIEGARRLGFPLGKDAIPSAKKTNVWLANMYEEQFERIKKDELEAT